MQVLEKTGAMQHKVHQISCSWESSHIWCFRVFKLHQELGKYPELSANLRSKYYPHINSKYCLLIYLEHLDFNLRITLISSC